MKNSLLKNTLIAILLVALVGLMVVGCGLDVEDTTHTHQYSEEITKAPVGKTVAEMERKLILDTMEDTMWNRSAAATILGISIRTLRNKLKQYQEEGYLHPSSNQG